MWRFKFGTQQDRSHSDLSLEAIIEEVSVHFSVMISHAAKLSTTSSNGLRTCETTHIPKWLFYSSQISVILSLRGRSAPRKDKHLLRGTIYSILSQVPRQDKVSSRSSQRVLHALMIILKRDPMTWGQRILELSLETRLRLRLQNREDQRMLQIKARNLEEANKRRKEVAAVEIEFDDQPLVWTLWPSLWILSSNYRYFQLQISHHLQISKD